jgi:hypothetical protein
MTMSLARARLGAAFFSLALAAGCGTSTDGTNPDPNTVGYSGPVSIRLDKFKDGEVHNNAFDSDKDVDTESGNPYAAFLRDARTALGRDPAAVVVDRITFTLASDTRGVTAFEQIFTGTAVVYVATSTVTVNVGTVVAPTGAGPVTVQITASRADLAPINAALIGGHFKVGMRVPAAPTRPASFDARVSTTLYFRALAL